MKHILFVCNQNLNRSPTAEEIFKFHQGWEVRSAGVYEGAKKQLSEHLLDWADIVFVMEDEQRTEISRQFPKQYVKKKIIVLDIPDRYPYGDAELVRVLKEKLKSYL